VALAFVFREEIANAIDVALGWLAKFGGKIMDLAGDVWDGLAEVAREFSEWASNLIDNAFEWGQDFIQGLIDGFNSLLGALTKVLEDLPIIGQLLDIFDRLSGLLTDVGGSVSIDNDGGGNTSGTGSGSGGGGSGLPSGLGSGGGATTIDGRRLDESTGRYGKDRNTRRGGGF